MASNTTTISLLLFLACSFAYCNAGLGLGLGHHEHKHKHKHKETKMTVYYQDHSNDPNRTVVGIPGPLIGPLNYTKFGSLFCADDPITAGTEESSAPIARAQGLLVASAMDGSQTQLIMSIVFVNKEYNGSTLELQGSSAFFEGVREVAVVGGTGKFRLARGYATFETVYYDQQRQYTVTRSNITVLHY